MPPTEVFLSHSSRDRKMASELASVLIQHGIPVFYSPHNIIGGQQWQDEILRALQRCDTFCVLLTPDATESAWVQREVSFALDERRFDHSIVPLIGRPCELGRLKWLKIFQMVDLSRDFSDGCRRLLRIWGVGAREELLSKKPKRQTKKKRKRP